MWKYASQLNQTILQFWIGVALAERLADIEATSSQSEHDLSALRELNESAGEKIRTICRKQWDRHANFLKGGERYGKAKVLQQNLVSEWKDQRDEIMRRKKGSGWERMMIESAEDTLFALSLRLAVIDTVLHVFEAYAETRTWEEWKEKPSEEQASNPFLFHLVAVREVVRDEEHNADLQSNNSIFEKVSELNPKEGFSPSNLRKSIKKGFKEKDRACPDGLSGWKAFFDAGIHESIIPEKILRNA